MNLNTGDPMVRLLLWALAAYPAAFASDWPAVVLCIAGAALNLAALGAGHSPVTGEFYRCKTRRGIEAR